MNFAFFLAFRYLIARKRRRAVHFITGIAISGITVGTAALILVLSVFNGFQDLLETMYGAIDPDIRIEAVSGRGLEDSEDFRKKLQDYPEIEIVTGTIEGKAAIQYEGVQRIVKIKGVEAGFTELNTFRKSITEGIYQLEFSDSLSTGVTGLGLVNMLGLRRDDYWDPPSLTVVPDKIKPGSSPEKSIRQLHFVPVAFFSFQKEYDENWVILPISMVQYLMNYESTYTAYEIKLRSGVSRDAFRDQLKQDLGTRFKVMTKFEIHEDIYRVMKNEKFAGYLILTLMLIIAGTNIVGSLAVIVIEKQKDISILKAMGASEKTIRNIFLYIGILVGGLGIGAGSLIAFLAGYTQMEYGWLGIEGGETFAVESYPLRLEWMDFIWVCSTVLLLSLAAAWGPAVRAAKFEVMEGLRR